MSFSNLNSQLPKPPQQHMYVGEVIDNNDPLHLDRIKCRVPELYDDSLGEVPWILPIKYCIFGQGPNFGSFGVPPIGAQAIIELQGNDPNFPIYRGFMLKQDNVKPEFVPGRYGIIDNNGSQLTIDTNKKILTYRHTTGVIFEIKEGNFAAIIPKNLTVNVSGDANVVVSGNMTTNVKGNMTASVTGNVDVSAAQATVTASGNITNKCSSFIVEASVAQLKCPVQTGNISNVFGSGGTGATISGGIKNTGGTVSSNGIVLDSHVHGGVDTGPGNTGGPK